MHADHLRVRLRHLGAEPNGKPTPIVPNGPEFRRWPGMKCGHGLASVVENFLSVDNQDAVAVHEVLDFLAKPQRMDIAILGVFVGARLRYAWPFRHQKVAGASS